MREIKFRAWDKDRKSMQTSRMYAVHFNGFLDMSKGRNSWRQDDFILMQYTGLKDKKGREIYEGDILEAGEGDPLVVRFDELAAGFSLAKKGWMFDHFFKEAVDSKDCEVIGNIYENKNLLEDR